MIRKGTRPLYQYIWFMVMGILLIFLAAITLTNSLILSSSKTDFYYKQLAASAESKRTIDRSKDLETLVNHYLLIIDGDDTSILADNRTNSWYMKNEDGQAILEAINQHILAARTGQAQDIKGHLDMDGYRYYYYTQISGEETELMVYIAESSIDPIFNKSFIIAFLITLLLSLGITKLLTNHLLKPLKSIKSYTQSIAHQDWHAPLPFSNTTEFQDLSNALLGMSQILETTQIREQQFLQSSSHNLKTPVMVIKGYAQALLDGVTLDNSETPPEIIRKEAELLEHRISQLLKLSTFGHAMDHQKELEAIRIDRLLNRQIRHFSVIRPDIKWDLSLYPLEIQANGEALLTALENLMENQMRYAKTRITITMATDEYEGRPVLSLTITNDGPCFTQKDPNVLFERYQKDQDGRWGLGLAIVQQIIEGHKGNIHAKNLENGVAFHILLPIF